MGRAGSKLEVAICDFKFEIGTNSFVPVIAISFFPQRYLQQTKKSRPEDLDYQ